MYEIKFEKDNLFQLDEIIPSLRGTYLFQKSTIAYEQEYGTIDTVYTCLLLKTKIIVGGFYYTVDSDLCWSYFKKPISVSIIDSLSSDDQFELMQILVSSLEQKMKKEELKKMKLHFNSFLFSSFMKFPVKLHSFYEALIDLKSSDETIKRGFRRRYRSLFNWGLREMTFERIDHLNPDEKKFEDFRNFHIEVSGRETRNKKTWDFQFEALKKGNAFVELGVLEGKLVSAALVLIGTAEAFYGVAVNNRTLMADKKPVGHATMLRAIKHAKELGLETFNLGYVGPEFSNDKEFEIARFKRGFASQIRLVNWFEIEYVAQGEEK